MPALSFNGSDWTTQAMGQQHASPLRAGCEARRRETVVVFGCGNGLARNGSSKTLQKKRKNDEILVELWAFKGDFWYVDYPNFSRAYAQRRKSWLLRGSLHQESTQVPTAMFCGEMGPPLYADYVSAASLLCMIQAAPSKRGAW